ncbi:MAG: 5'-methylthioadenosine/adenosylhomocysteine nucleosidase [Reyranellaceae bacterium]
MTATAPLGILSAIPEELRHLEDREDGSETIAGLVFHKGRIEGLAAVFVETGIGKVNAALTATILAQHFGCRALIFGGVAGGVDPMLGVGDVVLATRLVQHDYGIVIDGRIETYQPGVAPLPGIDATHGYDMAPALQQALRAGLADIELPRVEARVTGEAPRQARLHFGTVVSGDTFVNCGITRERLENQFGALAVEMEGGAVAQVAERFGLPWIVVRCLSDLAGVDSHVDFPAFLPLAAQAAARVVRQAVHAV